jgi:predicted dehydrogenase
VLRIDGEDQSEDVPHERAAGPDHVLGIEHLVECVDEGREPVAGVAHARHVIEVLEAAALSAVEGRSVAVESGVRTMPVG